MTKSLCVVSSRQVLYSKVKLCQPLESYCGVDDAVATLHKNTSLLLRCMQAIDSPVVQDENSCLLGFVVVGFFPFALH